jgi:ubiquinol-cytochrome c reductase iron-sulfur subunit
MSETQPSQDLPEEEGPQSRAPHRVIGTPPPAQARTLLGEAPVSAAPESPRELPAGPDNPAKAQTAEKVVATFFILSMLASIGFIAAYVGLEVGSVDATLRSNLALGLSMSVAFLAVGVGATIWVRNIMPNVEQVEERHVLASSEPEREAFTKSFTEGAEASGFVKRKLLRRTLIAASVPLAVAPLVVLRDLGPLPGTSLRHTVWRKGMRMVVYGPNTPLRAADFSIPGQMITVAPEGYTGPWTTSSRTPRSAPTSAARSRCTSRRPTTSSARAISPRSTRPTAPRYSSARRRGRCRNCRSGSMLTAS